MANSHLIRLLPTYRYFTIRYKTQRIMSTNIFSQMFNPISGSVEWVPEPEDYDYYREIARSAFADMLHDTERNQKYYKAIKKSIEKMHNDGKKANVLDIGTGTGLLSMMAVKCGADSVTACEAFRPMSECALKVIKENHCEYDIKIIPKRSTELTVGPNDCDMKEKANILVTEVFDTELIGEGALETFAHAHRELLEKDCLVVPTSATIYAQLVESPLALNWNRLKLLASSDGDVLLQTPDKINKCHGVASVHDVQLNQFPHDSFNTLLQPEPVLQFDWSGKITNPNRRQNVLVLKALRDGVAQAVFMWWDLKMDYDNEIVLSCAPYWAHPDFKELLRINPDIEFRQDLLPWRDHWMQAIYYLPEEVPVKKNEEITLISCHDQFSLWFNVKKNLKLSEADYTNPTCECNFHLGNSRTRIGQLNDGTRNKKYLNALEESVNSDTVLLSLNDGSLLAFAALKFGAKHVYCLERNNTLRKLTNDYITFNNLSDKVTIVETIENLKNIDLKSVNLVFAEPHYTTSLLPWDNFYFSTLLQTLKSHLSDDVQLIPHRGTIKAVAVEFLDLHKIRAPIGDCEGFIMDKFDKMIQVASAVSDSLVEPQPLWEYPCSCLSDQIEILHYDFHKLHDEFPDICGEFPLRGSGTCNGIALWVEWDLNGNPQNVVSTGPKFPTEVNKRIIWDMYTRQGVYLIPKPIDVQPPYIDVVHPHANIHFNATYNVKAQTITFKFKKTRTY